MRCPTRKNPGQKTSVRISWTGGSKRSGTATLPKPAACRDRATCVHGGRSSSLHISASGLRSRAWSRTFVGPASLKRRCRNLKKSACPSEFNASGNTPSSDCSARFDATSGRTEFQSCRLQAGKRSNG